MADSPGGYLVANHETGYGEAFPLDPALRYGLGRAPSNRIVLRDDLCSREHAELYCYEGDWYLRDLNSLNGSHVNEERLTADRVLESTDQLRFGNSRYLFLVDLADLPTHQPGRSSRESSSVAIKSRIGDSKYIATKKPATELPTAEVNVRGRHVSQSEAVALLFQLAVDSAAATSPADLAQTVLATIFAGTPAEVAAVLAVADGRDADPIAYRTRTSGRQTYHKVSSFVSAEVIGTGQAILAEDVAVEKKLKDRDSVNDLNAASLICAPVLVEGELLGLVHIYSTTSNRRLNGDDLDFALAVARQLGMAWQKLRRETGLSAEVKALKDRFQLASELVGASTGIKTVETQIARVAPMKTTVLIRGESGVGKELVARAVHNSSPRKDNPFICLNCAALTESLLESELFGHEKGAFTGATARLLGKFESADGGTIFLDEIGEMSIGTQAKLLRVLEGQTFERVGGNSPIRVDVRVVAATNRLLEDAVRDGHFRKDLFFRLQVVQIDVPPLRQRAEDVPLLAKHFFQHYAKDTGRKLKGFSPNAMKKLVAYHWPGNVRELRNVVERAVVLCAGPTIEDADIWLSPLDLNPAAVTPFQPKTLEECETEHIARTLGFTEWNKSKAAELLGIERSTLDRKIKAHGLRK